MIREATLNIFITDADPSHRDECSYTISVIDLNDNPPSFTESLYHFSVLENSEQGTLIGTVNVSKVIYCIITMMSCIRQLIQTVVSLALSSTV